MAIYINKGNRIYINSYFCFQGFSITVGQLYGTFSLLHILKSNMLAQNITYLTVLHLFKNIPADSILFLIIISETTSSPKNVMNCGSITTSNTSLHSPLFHRLMELRLWSLHPLVYQIPYPRYNRGSRRKGAMVALPKIVHHPGTSHPSYFLLLTEPQLSFQLSSEARLRP